MATVLLNLISQFEFISVKFKQKNNGRKRSAERCAEDGEDASTQPKRCSLAEANPVSPKSMETEQNSRSLLDSVSDVARQFVIIVKFPSAIMLMLNK